MWPFKKKQPVSSKTESLRCRDVPKHARREDESETYPQKSRPIQVMSLTRIVERYAVLIHGVVDNLPMSEEEEDRLIMPLIERLIGQVHLLPASESQHHSGAGGLLSHSLEVAGIAIRLAGLTLFDVALSLEQKYTNRTRWIVAAVVVAVIHDVGKPDGMRVSDEKGRVWNPNVQGLAGWLEEGRSTTYFVDWVPDREHKSHERRALRFAYRHVISDELLAYLAGDGTGRILAAIEDAILIGQGPLADILSRADSQSAALDAARRKRIASDMTYLSSPLVTPVVDAMKDNLRSGLWKVNVKGATVFVTTLGVLVRAATETGNDIRKTAVTRGHQGVPADFDQQMRVLGEAGLVETTLSGEVVVLNVGVGDQRMNCIRFLVPERLFSQALPSEVEATITHDSTDQKETAAMGDRKLSSLMETMKDGTNYAALMKERLSRSQSELKVEVGKPSALAVAPASPPETERVSSDECAEVLKTPLSKEGSRTFARRLFESVLTELRDGSNLLVTDRREETNSVVCSSAYVEKVAANHGVSLATLEALFTVLNQDPQFHFDALKHIFEWRK